MNIRIDPIDPITYLATGCGHSLQDTDTDAPNQAAHCSHSGKVLVQVTLAELDLHGVVTVVKIAWARQGMLC